MSFISRETSIYSASPVDCYKFSRAGAEWFFTSADQAVTLPSIGTFLPLAVMAGGQHFRDEDAEGQLEVRLPRTSEITSPYIAGVPPEETWLKLYRAHRGEESDPVVLFFGLLDHVRFEGSEAVAVCLSMDARLTRRVPGLSFSVQCNWALYSTECGLNAADFEHALTVATVSGVNVTSTDFAAQASGYFTGGWLDYQGDKRFIVDHTGDTVQLMWAFPSLPAGASVLAYRGCDHTRAACLEFGNHLHFLGFEWIPTRDPSVQRIRD